MIALTLLMAVAQAPTAPRAPPVKGGSFSCRVFTDGGQKVMISGELGNWREGERTPLADIQVTAPVETRLSFRTSVVMELGGVNFLAYDRASNTAITGKLDIGYARDGTILLVRKVLNEAGSRELYAGFCDTFFSAAPRKLHS